MASSHHSPSPADALSRCLLGIDSDDRTLFASACVTDASMTVVAGPITLSGWEEVSSFFERLFGLVTLHITSNIQVTLEGERKAKLAAHAVAHHVRPEEAVSVEERKYTAGCLYEIGLVRDGEDSEGGDVPWKIQRWEIKVLWTTGDRAVLHD